MCFSAKTKQPKVDPTTIAAPAPVMEEAPKGVEFGDGSDDSKTTDTTDGIKDLKVSKEAQGDGTPASPVATDTGTVKKSASSSIRRALKR